MQKLRPKTLELYKAIRADFTKMSDEKEFGVQKFTTAFILEKLAEKYYKSSKTIENIVFSRRG